MPLSYTLAHEVEEAEDEGLVEVEWLPFGLRPALAAWERARISALRCVREEGLGIGVHGVPAIATKEEVL